MEVTSFKSLGPRLKDTVLWRNVGIRGSASGRYHSAEINDVDFEKTARGSFMARTNLPGMHICEPEVWFSKDAPKTHGLVTFLPTLPPPDWKFLVVTGVSTSGTVIFAKYVPHTISDDQYRDWRVCAFHVRTEHLNSPAEDLLPAYLEVAQQLPIPHKRIAIANHWMAEEDDGPRYCYAGYEYMTPAELP